MANEGSLTIALTPYAAPSLVMGHFEMLRKHLERDLAIAIQVVVPEDDRSMLTGCTTGAYDLAMLTSPLVGALQSEGGWQLLVDIEPPSGRVSYSIYVREGYGGQGIASLKGKSISLPRVDPILRASVAAALTDAGLIPERDVHLETHAGYDSAFHALLSRKVAAAAAVTPIELMLIPDLLNSVKVLQNLGSVPPASFMIHDRISTELRSKLLATLVSHDHPVSAGEPDADRAWKLSPARTDAATNQERQRLGRAVRILLETDTPQGPRND